jgi:hypothetical protein
MLITISYGLHSALAGYLTYYTLIIMEDEDDDWVPSNARLKIVNINAADEALMPGLHEKDDLELHDPVKDIKYEKWAEEKFGKSETVLSCPKCFTAVAYDAILDGQNFLASKTVNTVVGKTYQKSKDEEVFLSVECSICGCDLGLLDPTTHNYHLFHVLEGYG